MHNEHYLTETIKNLRPLEIFDYFDGPRFYSCVSKSGQLYLVFWVDETENASSWLYVQVSQDRYTDLKAGHLAIREAFLQAEEGYVFLITVNKTQALEITPLYAGEIPSDYLPESDDFLSPVQESLNAKTLKTFIESLKSSLPQLELSSSLQAELQADLQTLETQQTSPNPKPIIIRECLRSIQRVLQRMVDQIGATGLLNRLAVLMG